MTIPAPEDTLAPHVDATDPAGPAAPAAVSPDQVLTIPLDGKQAALVERVARMRLNVKDPQTPVNLGEYIRQLINKDVAACLKEIQTRRGG